VIQSKESLDQTIVSITVQQPEKVLYPLTCKSSRSPTNVAICAVLSLTTLSSSEVSSFLLLISSSEAKELKGAFGTRFFHRKSEGNQNGGKEDGHGVWNKGKKPILSFGIL